MLTVLADPTRRLLVDALRNGPLTVGDLAKRVPVSRSAVSQHLRVLRAAEVVDHDAQGTRRHYYLRAERLGDLREHLDQLWGDALAGVASRVAAKASKTRNSR
jgi:DNA-binding transcriptional ArsR family regulator